LNPTAAVAGVSTAVVNQDYVPLKRLTVSGTTVTITTEGHSGFIANKSIIVAGFSNSANNGTFTISTLSADASGANDLITFTNNNSGIANNTAADVKTAYALSADIFAITGASNAAPIVITSNSHGLSTGQKVFISGVGGNTAANGTWT